jgi:hypothetical protein
MILSEDAIRKNMGSGVKKSRKNTESGSKDGYIYVKKPHN